MNHIFDPSQYLVNGDFDKWMNAGLAGADIAFLTNEVRDYFAAEFEYVTDGLFELTDIQENRICFKSDNYHGAIIVSRFNYTFENNLTIPEEIMKKLLPNRFYRNNSLDNI